MDSLRIDTGTKRLMINDDPSRVIEFNPTDIVFAEKFYNLINEFTEKQKEYERRSGEIGDGTILDTNGIPVNLGLSLALLREACEFMRSKIDGLFGVGTSQAAFGNALTLDVFAQFFEGITPFIQKARDAKMTRYLNTQLSGKVMK